MMVPVSIYGGYFGAGVGVLLIAALSVANGGDYRAANVTKNFVGSLINLAAAIDLRHARARIAWIPALLVARAPSAERSPVPMSARSRRWRRHAGWSSASAPC